MNTNITNYSSFYFLKDNGGTILGIAGKDFAVLAGDTRHTTSYSINSRYQPKVFDVGDDIVISANGFSADGDALVERFQQQLKVCQNYIYNFTVKILE